MTSIAELVTKAILLISTVDSLKSDVKRLNDLIMDVRDRLIRLENAGELNAEKAKSAAMAGTHLVVQALQETVFELKARVDNAAAAIPPPTEK